MKRKIIIFVSVFSFLINSITYSQNQQVRKYSGSYKDGTATYSYYEDANGNIILHGHFEYSYEQRDIDEDNKYTFDRHVVFKGEFKDGKKEGEWSYSYPIFNSNEANAVGGGEAEVQITLDRDRITESNYTAKEYLPGDHYLVEIGQFAIKANYLNGNRNGVFKTTIITKITEYEKLAGKPPKFIKFKNTDKNENTLNFQNGIPFGKASIIFNGKPLLTGEFNSEGNMDGIWKYYSPSFSQTVNSNIIENIKFKNGFILLGQQININKNDTLINIINDNINTLLSNLENPSVQDLGYFIGDKKKIDDEIISNMLPKYNEIPIEKFQGFNNQLLELFSSVYLVYEQDIDYYNKQNENVDCFNFNNFVITDENKVKKLFGDPFDKIYKENIKAIGGENAIKNITNYKIIKTIIKSRDRENYDSQDQEYEKKGLIKFKSPDKYYLEFPECFNFFNSIYFWYNGKRSFIEYSYKTIEATSPKDNDFFIFKTMVFPLYQMKEKGYKFELIEKDYDKNNILIKATSPNGLVIDVFIDKVTFLVIGYNIYVNSKSIDNHNYQAFKDVKGHYKEYNGVLLPWIEKNGKYEYRFEYQLNVPISNSEFEAEYQVKPKQPNVEGW